MSGHQQRKGGGYSGPRQPGDPRGQRPDSGPLARQGFGGRAPSGSGTPERSLDEMWPDYLNGGYFEGKDAMGNPALKPEMVARVRMESLVRAMAPTLTSHQARRFFQHCRAIQARLLAKEAEWSSEVTSFMMLDVAAADAAGKRPPKIPSLFHDFIRRNVAAVKTREDFLIGFLPHFEALIGFGSSYLKEKERS